MGVPAIAVAEITKCGGQLVTRIVENITQFNVERMNLKTTAIKGIYGTVMVYEGNNKIYIESSEKALEKILKAIPADADPDKVVELLIQSQRNHNILLGLGMVCMTIVTSVAIHSVSAIISASVGKSTVINNYYGINIRKK